MQDLLAEGDFHHSPEKLREHLGTFVHQTTQSWNLESNRREVWRELDNLRFALWKWLRDGDTFGRDYARLFNLVIHGNGVPATVYRAEDGEPAVEVHSVRPALRRTLSGAPRTDLVVEVTQRRAGYFDEDEQKEHDAGPPMKGRGRGRGRGARSDKGP